MPLPSRWATGVAGSGAQHRSRGANIARVEQVGRCLQVPGRRLTSTSRAPAAYGAIIAANATRLSDH